MAQPSAELAANSVTMPSGHGSPSASVDLEGAEQPRHVRVAGAGQHPVELDVGVDARRDPAEHLEDGVAGRRSRWCCSARRPTPAARRPAAGRAGLRARTARPADRAPTSRSATAGSAAAPGRTARRSRCGRRRRRSWRRVLNSRSARSPSRRSPGSARAAVGVVRRRAARGRGRRAAATTTPARRSPGSRLRPAYHRCCGSHSDERQAHWLSPPDPHSWNQ